MHPTQLLKAEYGKLNLDDHVWIWAEECGAFAPLYALTSEIVQAWNACPLDWNSRSHSLPHSPQVDVVAGHFLSAAAAVVDDRYTLSCSVAAKKLQIRSTSGMHKARHFGIILSVKENN